MIDFRALISEEKNLGKNPAAAYKADAFISIDNEISRIKDEDKMMDLREEARNLLEEDSGSIVLSYVAGRILLALRPHEYNMRLNNLLLSFYEAGNWDVVKYIGDLILSASESSKALRVLGDVADHQGEEEKKWDYYERLVKADSSDHDIIVIVADHFEKIGDRKSAMNYYQRALLRLQGTDEIQKMKDIFTKLIANGRSEYPFYSSFLESLSETNPETALELYRTLLSALLSAKDGYEPKSSEHRRNLDNIIEISKRILAIDPEDQNTRKTLAAILKEKYAESPRLQECMKKHNVLTQKNPASVLEDFEKDISYAAGTYIFQKANRRVGLITGVKNGIVSVRYSATEEQNITLESAFNALLPLSKQNIKAIKKGVPAPKIKAKIMGEGGIEWLVRTLLLSAQNNKASMKEMKTEVVPSILTDGEWKSITERIKEELRNNSYVRIIPGTTDYFQLTAYPSTPEEKILYIFRNEQSFYGKASTVIDAATSAGIEKTSDAFMDMVSYFEDVLSNEKKSLGERTASVLLLDYLSEKGASVSFDVSFDVLYRAMSETEKKEVFDSIDNTILKKEFIDQVISADKKGAAAVLTDIFPCYISSYIPQKLKRLQKGAEYYALLRRSVESFRDNIPAFVFFSTEYSLSEADISKAGLDEERIFRTKLMALSYLSKAGDTQENRKHIKSLRKNLVDDGVLMSFLKRAGKEEIEASLSLILFNEGFESEEKARFKAEVESRFPDLAIHEEKKPEPKAPETKTVSGFLCTSQSYEKKKDELKDINQVQMPEILKEINFARELGDLRENSEYQYAKDHKRELERRISELNNDLSTVRIMTMADVIPGLIGFGTKVTLHDNLENKDIVYTFMGRWESEPEKGIIDFNAPLGQQLVNHKEGEDVKFSINGRDYDLTVKSIEPVEF